MEHSTGTKLRVLERHFRTAQPTDGVRRRALARLYERRSAVEKLIDALERYQQEQRERRVGSSIGRSTSNAVEMSS